MKIKREENKIIFAPETEWELDQLKDFNDQSTRCLGFEHPWEDMWNCKGGLVFRTIDPYE